MKELIYIMIIVMKSIKILLIKEKKFLRNIILIKNAIIKTKNYYSIQMMEKLAIII